ncbi:MAG: energy-coupling factor transporter transmembrane component T [Bacillota bacterium]|nr:energy-coupling factor transporter transmembrane component T [Bacillota bacterium]
MNNAFSKFHPLSSFIYFVCVIGFAVFTQHPIIRGIGLISGICFFILLNERNVNKELAFILMFFFIIAITNPLFFHDGKTVLFFLHGNAITLESIIAGISMSVMMISAVFWLWCFGIIFTCEKVMYLFSKISPKISLIISMIMRFIPLLKDRHKQTQGCQKAMGLYTSDKLTDRVKSAVRIFSILVTYALEHSLETETAMRARGFSSKKRTSGLTYSFKKRDSLLLAICLTLSLALLFGAVSEKLQFYYYPSLSINASYSTSVMYLLLFFILAFMPVFIEIKEAAMWKYSLSKI